MKLSIILPVYNVAPYLKACLESVQAAVEGLDAEIICVDDGSTDGSGDILKTFDVTIIRQSNRGVSAARNAGLDAATGDVITFVDPDDTVAPTHFRELLAAIVDADVVWAGYTRDGAAVRPYDVGMVYEGDAARRRIWRAVFGYRLRDLWKVVLPGGLWNNCRREFGSVCWRAFRRDVIGEMRFDETLKLYEDALFLSCLAPRVKKLKITGGVGYDYRVRPTGAMSLQHRTNLLAAKVALRDARRAIDPKMTAWRGTFLLSFFEVWHCAGVRAALRYLR